MIGFEEENKDDDDDNHDVDDDDNDARVTWSTVTQSLQWIIRRLEAV
jgi:hypothetical protein